MPLSPPRRDLFKKVSGLRPWTRHSLVLMVAGAVYVFVGMTYMVAGNNVSRNSSMRLQLEWLPIQGWGLIFFMAGILSIISSRWPPASETWGYTALTGLSAGWSAFYLGGIINGAPIQNLTTVALWGIIGFLWWAISGLVNPSTQRRPVVILNIDPHANKAEVESIREVERDITKDLIR